MGTGVLALEQETGKRTPGSRVVVARAFNPSIGEAEEGRSLSSEFETRLVYRDSSRTASGALS